jgi:hypothetical protein
MEVLLKKFKITASILAQTLIADVANLKSEFVLGWCIYKKHKYIILYNSLTTELRKYPMPKIVVLEYDNYNKKFTVRVEFTEHLTHHIYNMGDETLNDAFAVELKNVKGRAESAGQFFF